MILKDYISQFLNIELEKDIRCLGLADSTRLGTISFLEDLKFTKNLTNNMNICAVFIKKEYVTLIPKHIECVIVEKPKATFFEIHNRYCKEYLVYPPNRIANSANIHPSVYIADTGVIIHENVSIGPNTTILSGVEIGANTTIGANCVLGDEGFHTFDDLDGIKQVVCHDGWLKLGKNVHIQACVELDKGMMGRNTEIGDECCLDNFVHIAHRVHIGPRASIACSSSIAGSADVGNDVWIGAHCVVSNRIKVGDKARILIGSVVIDNIKSGTSVSGNFAVPHEKHLIANAKMMFEIRDVFRDD